MEPPSKQETFSLKRRAGVMEESKKTKKTKKVQEEQAQEVEEVQGIIQAITPQSSLPQSQQASSSSSSGNLEPFPNLFYGEDAEDVSSWTNILIQNGYKNEERLCRNFLGAYGNDKNSMITRLKNLTFNEEIARIIAKRILSFSGSIN